MPTEENLIYEVQVKPLEKYEIAVRIGDANPGDHNVIGTCPFETKPVPDNPEWKSSLDSGDKIKDKNLFVTSSTVSTNPNSNFVSVRVFINDKRIEPKSGQYKFTVAKKEIVYFNLKINFI